VQHVIDIFFLHCQQVLRSFPKVRSHDLLRQFLVTFVSEELRPLDELNFQLLFVSRVVPGYTQFSHFTFVCIFVSFSIISSGLFVFVFASVRAFDVDVNTLALLNVFFNVHSG